MSHTDKLIQKNYNSSNQIENKKFNPSQAKEALKDPKTWIWFVFCILVSIPNSLSNQISIIVVSFGYTIKQTTLLGCGFGMFTMISMFLAVKLIDKIKNSRGLVAASFYLPSLLGAILVITLPWKNQAGLLGAMFLATLCATPFVVSLGWIVSTTGGHTKRVVVQAIILIGYCLGNIFGPQMWKSEYKPRNKIPWAIITTCFGSCMMILLGIREYFKRENDVRNNATTSEEKASLPVLDSLMMDLTDLENSSTFKKKFL
ncbi:hypothetical protein CROQUDRAFT_44420 [Cronartium quercuum f. sp. fusiforme G11]|uniref:Transporter n=1 Tax=Cronartium quercuum f. sp. fusiforme G11 TaxID=708437 RepID=A0A9P6NI60_9BASI|nr:hypothetical protein CROQUDRAFT_44420 [Cronartium quercuum f. sp. fusiforme G11]